MKLLVIEKILNKILNVVKVSYRELRYMGWRSTHLVENKSVLDNNAEDICLKL